MDRDDAGFVLAVMTGLDWYQLLLLRGIRASLAQRGLPVIVHTDDRVTDEPASSLTCLITHRRPLGIILTPSLSGAQDQALGRLARERGIPVVRLGQDIRGETCVRADNVQGMTLLTAHLLDDFGARRPALLYGTSNQTDHVDRELAFRAELQRRGLPLDEELILATGTSLARASVALTGLLNEHPDIDAVVTMDDRVAAMAVDLVGRFGRVVGDDIAVSGFDNYPLSTSIGPGITSVDQRLEEQGAQAGEALLDLLDGAPPGTHHLTPCVLVVRGSTFPDHPGGLPDQPILRGAAELVHQQLATQESLIRLCGALIGVRAVEELRTPVEAEVGALGIDRFFLALYEQSESIEEEPDGSLASDEPATRNGPTAGDEPAARAGSDACRHRPARLVCDHHAGTGHTPLPQRFTNCLLPGYLAAEMSTGTLCRAELVVGRRAVGYLLFEPSPTAVPVLSTIRTNLERALAVVLPASGTRIHP